MTHDRIHAREPSHHTDRWSVGTIQNLRQQDGHCVVTVETQQGDSVDLTVTLAVQDLFVGRLDLDADDSPVGEKVWYRKHGDGS
ncbi:hypothetical protein [Salinibaculum rarum]|uniref:DUF7861 family protein n=1 Tax=Salinibaculum rarum TaxID=3058903 RepID=UPI00265FBBFE|nr:hypothetical protein [Salinibaculum sp. KK48]